MNGVMKRYGGSPNWSIGMLVLEDGFECFVLERPFRDNLPNISSIPAGEYKVSWTLSPKFSRRDGHDVYTYEILNVPGRSGIRIHSAGMVSELYGCLAPFRTARILAGQIVLSDSRKTTKDLELWLNGQQWQLSIIGESDADPKAKAGRDS